METELFLNKVRQTAGFSGKFSPSLAAIFFAVLGAVFFTVPAFSQESLRFQLWTHLETLPAADSDAAAGSAAAADPYALPAANLKKLAVFVLEGMIYGWEFSYTPSDQTRGVEEYFEMTPVQRVAASDSRLTFDSPYLEENRLYCWVTYALAPEQVRRIKSWGSAAYPKIQGSGSASLFDGEDGLRQSYERAVLAAVRSYGRSLIKNKPKEITGTVLLTTAPRLRVVAGRYIADVVLNLSPGKIIPYAVF